MVLVAATHHQRLARQTLATLDGTVPNQYCDNGLMIPAPWLHAPAVAGRRRGAPSSTGGRLTDLHQRIDDEEVRRHIEEVRSALNVLVAELPQNDRSAEGVRDLGLAVDNVRQSLWAVLTSQRSGDYASYIGEVRVQRAVDACEDVLSDLYADAMASSTPGLAVFCATLRELAEACREKQR